MCLKFFLSLFIYFERESDREHEWGRGREREEERIPSRLRPVRAEPDTELELTHREIVT